MEILIDKVEFVFEEVSFFESNMPNERRCTDAHVHYTIPSTWNVVKGTLRMPFDTYQKCDHRDLTQKVYEAVRGLFYD